MDRQLALKNQFKSVLEANPSLSNMKSVSFSAFDPNTQHAINPYPSTSAISEHNQIINELWDFRRQEEPRFDPVRILPPELIHHIFTEALNWFDIKYGMDVIHDVPRAITDGPLTLTRVSEQWRNFVLEDPYLWSQILIDTNDPDSLDHLQLYLHLSHTTNLFIVLQGCKSVSGTLLELLMQESYRISNFIHPYGQPLLGLDDIPVTLRDSPEPLCPFINIIVYNQSHKPNPPKIYLYPPYVHTLWLHGYCPYSMMSALLSFQLLSELRVDILPPEEGVTSPPQMPIVLPKLHTFILGIRWWSRSDWRLSRLVSCPSLKLFRLNAHFQINQHSFQAYIAMLHDLTCFPLLESLEFTLNMVPSKRDFPSIWNQNWLHEPLASNLHPQVPTGLQYMSLHLVRTGHGRGRKYNNLIWERFEDIFIERMEPLTDLVTSRLRDLFLPCLRRLILRLLHTKSPPTIVTFPRLEILEVQTKYGYDNFAVLEQIRAPNLQRLYIIVSQNRGHCERTTFDCRDITRATTLHISLRVDSGDRILTFQLPSCFSLVVCGWMELDIAEPLPSLYSLETGKAGSRHLVKCLDALRVSAVTQLMDIYGGFIGITVLTRLSSLQKITLSSAHKISSPSSTHELLWLLAENVHLCPSLTSITLSEYPSNWESFLSALRIRNCTGLLKTHTSIIQELVFLGGLHRNIVACLKASIQGKFVELTSPPSRQGKHWPARPVKKTKEFYRSCYLCHISGFELGCMHSDTQAVDCGRERGERVAVRAV